MIYYAYEPFGPRRADLHTGIIASTLINSWGGKTTPADFMPPEPTFSHRADQEQPPADDGYVPPEQMLRMIDDLMARQEHRKAVERKRGQNT